MIPFLTTKNSSKGMTFIEVIVVMGIFAAIAATVLFNYRDFSSGVKLQNLAQEIALQGKRAQTLATQGRRPLLSDAQLSYPELVPPDWVSSYGLAFYPSAYPETFIFYFNSPVWYYSQDPQGDSPDELNQQRDVSFTEFSYGDFYFGCGTSDSECMEEINITDGSTIDLVCVNAEPIGVNADPNCDTIGTQPEKLYVSFTRPLLDAFILYQDGSQFPERAQYGFVRVSSADGSQKRYITFWSTGQIMVN